MPSYDFVYDMLEKMESQGFDYYLLLIDKDPKGENDKIIVYTTFTEGEFNKVIEAIRKNNNKQKKTRTKKSKNDSPDI